MKTEKWSINTAAVSDCGRISEQNDDRHFADERLGVWMVADGMGPTDGASVASETTINVTARMLASHPFLAETPASAKGAPSEELAREVLGAAIGLANREVHYASFADWRRAGMGSTLVAMMRIPGTEKMIVANVGDSRCYRFRDRKLERLTQDHSWVEQMVSRGLLSPGEARASRWRNFITRAIGSKVAIEIGWQIVETREDDVYLLCSDGLWSELADDEIAFLLESHASLERRARMLVDLANSRGGRDNITALLVGFERAADAGLETIAV